MRIVSLQVGRPRTLAAADGRVFRTSLLKTPVDGPVRLGPEDLEGNYQACRKYHGGPDKAICCFPSEHYPAAAEFLGHPLSFGAFGENFTLGGMTEHEVCIGDRYRAGEAAVEVSQPRQPCATLSKRYGSKKLLPWMIESGATGWYFRTVEEGLVDPAAELILIARPNPAATIAEMNRLMFANQVGVQALQNAVDLPQLSADWRATFTKRLRAATP